MTNALTIPSRFNGPAGIGNGGYVCGRIAAYVDGPATVTLRRPPPLDTPMAVERDEGSVRVLVGGTLIGEAAPAPDGRRLELASAVSLAEARAAAGRARYFADPVFPDCFVCGMNRPPGDGLRIFPGPVAGRWGVGGAVDTGSLGRRRRREGTAGGGLGGARLSQRDRRRRGGRPGRRRGRSGLGHAILLGRMTASLAATARGRRPVPGDRLAANA